MRNSTKWIVGIVAVLLVGLFFIKMKNSGDKTTRVTTEKAAHRTIIESVSTTGKIYPETEVKVSPDFSGQVTELKVAEGDIVKKGQLLARINDRTSIESPIDGVVLAMKVKKGESVTGNNFSQGTEMFVIADMSVFEVRVDVGENDIVKIKEGDSATVSPDAYNNRKFPGVVTHIANTVKSSGNSFNTSNDVTNYEVRIRLDSAAYKDLDSNSYPFRPGMNATVDIRTVKKENILSVPRGAVAARLPGSDKNMDDKKKKDKADADKDIDVPAGTEMEEVVFVLQKDNTVKKVSVQSGILDINYIEIISGLQEGEEVVTSPYSALSKTLRDGMKVKVVAKQQLFE